jgi:ABC-type uncharacterized transport system involved in gliding motility auxiliary subunit
MNKRLTLGGGALLLLAVLFIGLTVVSSYLLRGVRVDLTQNHLYTTTPGTAHILQGLKEPVNLYFFFSDKASGQFPPLRAYGTRVREFLQEIAARAHGKIRLNVIDPQPFSEGEDQATEFGVKSVPIGNAGESLYFGLAGTNSTDGRSVIEFFDPAKEEFLEYDIAKLIYQLGNPKKPVVAWLSSIPMTADMDPRTGEMREPWAVLAQVEQLYTVRRLEASMTKIDPDVDVLVLVHPKDLPPAAQFAIDQYALRGGRLLVYVDPHAEQDQAGGEDPRNPLAAMGADRSSHLDALLAAWGVDFNPGVVVGDSEHAMQVSLRGGEAPVLHLAILGLDASSFTKGDVVTAGLSNINVETAGFVAPRGGATTKFEPILQTGTQAGPIPVERFAMLMDPSTLREGFRPTGKRYAIGARVTGMVSSAFPQGPPAGVQLAPGASALKSSVKPLNLVIYADSDMLADFLWVRQQNFLGQRVAQAWASNGDLAWNTLDNLAGSTDLIGVRGRATFTRPFDRVEQLRRRADERFRAKERELESQLQSTEQKLLALQTKRNDKSALILTPEQEQEINDFQKEKLRIRKDLREVRHGLDEEIHDLGNRLKFLNIVVVPAMFAVFALVLAAWRRKRHAAIVMLQRDAERQPAS